MSSQKSSFYFQNSFPVPPLFQPPRISSKLSDFPINFLNFNEEEISRKQINDDYVNVSEFNLEEEKNRENMQNPNDFEDNNFLKKKPEQTDFVKKNINPGCLMEIEEESRTPSNAFNSSAEKTPTKSSRVSNYGVDATVVNKFPRNEGGGSNNNIINLWRNSQTQVFQGKFSTGATPKPSRESDKFLDQTEDIKPSANLILENFKRKTSRRCFDYAEKLEKFQKSDKKVNPEKMEPLNNFDRLHRFVRPDNKIEKPETNNFESYSITNLERTPSPKGHKIKDYAYNTMSIKRERKIFNKNTDLEMEYSSDSDFDGDSRYMSSTQKSKKNSGSYSRFINDYEVKEVIGTGCFGTVYRCLNKFDNMEYAIKCTKSRLKGSKSRDLSLNEAQALAAFSATDENCYIVRYYNAWIEDERLYLAMENCKYSLKYLKQTQKTFSESQIRHILRDVSLGLKSLHKKNVVHLDIKPENILLSQTDKYKISDLGLSRIAKRSRDEEINEGDSRYLAPEMLHDYKTGVLPDLTKADIFSLGVTIYELITGENVPSNGDGWHAIRRLSLSKLDSIHNYSETLKKLIKEMMNPNPDYRPSAEQLLVSNFLRSELEMELIWQKKENEVLKEKLEDYEMKMQIKRKKSF